MADGRLYFAYGSNINLEQMACRCPDATVVGPVMLEGYELLFRRKEGGTVHGLLWSIAPECERSLDNYEVYPRFYGKRMVSVRDNEGRSLSAMAYIMDERFREPMMPSESYYAVILEGYRQNGLPVIFLKEAWEHTAEEIHAETERINNAFIKRSRPLKGGNSHER